MKSFARSLRSRSSTSLSMFQSTPNEPSPSLPIRALSTALTANSPRESRTFAQPLTLIAGKPFSSRDSGQFAPHLAGTAAVSSSSSSSFLQFRSLFENARTFFSLVSPSRNISHFVLRHHGRGGRHRRGNAESVASLAPPMCMIRSHLDLFSAAFVATQFVGRTMTTSSFLGCERFMS